MIFPSMLDIQSGTHIYQASTRPLSGVLVLLSFTVISLKSEEHIPIVSAPLILPWAILKPSAPPPFSLLSNLWQSQGLGVQYVSLQVTLPLPSPPPQCSPTHGRVRAWEGQYVLKPLKPRVPYLPLLTDAHGVRAWEPSFPSSLLESNFAVVSLWFLFVFPQWLLVMSSLLTAYEPCTQTSCEVSVHSIHPMFLVACLLVWWRYDLHISCWGLPLTFSFIN